ncbi:monothiol glutaredoxin-S6-like [Senna tora]|uniref:Monothiol glutaredoxin-S6-like n=1 Tax=Senna tora TaxID=362788 RepID=A0A834TC71_9FABA|nr:monothiol glutaredoxin-S6-like [Senna tora]
MDIITSMIAEKPVVIFSKSNCCLSYSIKSLISGFGANTRQQIERALIETLGCQPSVPAVFIGQQFVGGANKIMSLHLRNELVTLLMNARAIWLWNKK